MVSIQFTRFIIIGILTTIINYSGFYILYQLLGVYYITASATGFLLGVITGYFYNKKWTFEVQRKSYIYIIKYHMVYGTSLILSLMFLKILVDTLGILPHIANILVIGITTCTNFIGTKCWVFKE